MKSKTKKISLIILICLGKISIVYIVLPIYEKAVDLSEIWQEIAESKVEYQSERGFGNDRLDIYSFSLKNSETGASLKSQDEELHEYYTLNFEGLMNSKAKYNENLKTLKKEIDILRQRSDVKYRIAKEGSKAKLFLYSKELNKGYCLIYTL